MTHGEELGSDMHQDPVVLTYLEGLRMHQAAARPAPVVDRKPSGLGDEGQSFKISGRAVPGGQSNGPSVRPSTCQGSGVLHLKKARLLQSSEDWDTPKRRRLSDSLVDLDVKPEALLAGMVGEAPKGKQDSTLLASLLQSFSSRLQSVALSQQIRQSLKEQGCPLKADTDARCYGLASTHLKTLLRRSKTKEPEPAADPPDGAAEATGEPLSCAARLQAVASMVEKRSSPAASPKPSVACSQLALLLSSEAHLQQYSREHALKAQSAHQVASERLAAMARLQESGLRDRPHFPSSRALASPAHGPARPSSSESGAALPSPPRSADCGSGLRQASSHSLLLHLLKSQSAAGPAGGPEQPERGSAFEGSSASTTDDGSDPNPSFTEDDSSGDESSHSNCGPIDLSFKQRVQRPEAGRPASLDSLTQSLLHTWDPRGPGLRTEEEAPRGARLNPHQKVTLLQLLLGHKHEERPEQAAAAQGSPGSAPGSQRESPGVPRAAPRSTPPSLACAAADSPLNLSQQPLGRRASPQYLCAVQPQPLASPAARHLVDRSPGRELPAASPPSAAAFSASKLLQNLAAGAADEPRACRPPPKPAGLGERRGSPQQAFRSPPEPGLSGSEIENLLERRTVLQLLLGHGSRNRSEKQDRAPDESCREQAEILAVQIKSEPCDDPPVLPSGHRPTHGLLGALPALHRGAAASPSEDLKAEPPSPQDFSRNGLLSRLLRQNQEAPLTDGQLLEPQGRAVAPKKRKLPGEPAQSLFKKRMKSQPCPEEPRGAKWGGSDLQLGPSAGRDPGSEPPGGHWHRESQGFNVLKQLLLSENCVRDLSGHRKSTASEGRKRGGRNHVLHGGPDLSLCSLNGQLASCLGSRTFPYAGAGPGSPYQGSPEPLASGASTQEAGPLSVCPIPGERGPIKWVIAGLEKSECARDSPRLTKTNPILYYMLQKGASSGGLRDAWSESPARSTARVAVKEELSSPCESPSHGRNASGEAYGLLQRVLTIKKEAE
ncbi:nuclear receptor-interacting protein 1 [Monodelphis domestica]|uniref:nuclear receptor-interacting protein 1 n=1 Tax=Monodelphis domestica TaxID=13616 RepID=UPI0024E20514|nr:nuclear receptor-interacting protein 1 [Monodelphis domestica]XP_056681926.1 nuclear receptor-interacting protein 1 [Monodelphis domestica]XP_056681927.1 nuclear receptor-interacting protein 1 [Monodelphis domestica]XP_056681928.1 nuclear receptor-interacting protein 1 [Monodelphis domestica]